MLRYFELKPGMLVRPLSAYKNQTIDPIKLLKRLDVNDLGEQWAAEWFGSYYSGKQVLVWITENSEVYLDHAWQRFSPACAPF